MATSSPVASSGVKPLRKGPRIAIDQAVACLNTAPDGSATLVRKAVQLAICEATPKGGGWNERLESLLTSKSITDLGSRAARRVNALGDWGAHVPRGLTRQAALECLEFGRIVLAELGYDVSGFGDNAEMDRLRRYVHYLTEAKWEGPRRFDTLYLGGWMDGGLIDLLFACPSCGGEILAEDLDVPTNWGGEVESEQSCDVECPVCGSSYELIATSRVEGWFVNVNVFERLAGGGRLGARDPNLATVPPPWNYLYRVTMDRGDRDRFSEDVDDIV